MTIALARATITMSNIIDRRSVMNERMKAARLAKNLSQTELAKIIGVSRQTINMIENGDYNPTIALCIKISKTLDKTLNDLFWEE